MTTLTPAELDAARLLAIQEQTEAIKAQTAALIAAREASQEVIEKLAAIPLGLTEAFVLNVLRLVLDKPA